MQNTSVVAAVATSVSWLEFTPRKLHVADQLKLSALHQQHLHAQNLLRPVVEAPAADAVADCLLTCVPSTLPARQLAKLDAAAVANLHQNHVAHRLLRLAKLLQHLAVKPLSQAVAHLPLVAVRQSQSWQPKPAKKSFPDRLKLSVTKQLQWKPQLLPLRNKYHERFAL